MEIKKYHSPAWSLDTAMRDLQHTREAVESARKEFEGDLEFEADVYYHVEIKVKKDGKVIHVTGHGILLKAFLEGYKAAKELDGRENEPCEQSPAGT